MAACDSMYECQQASLESWLERFSKASLSFVAISLGELSRLSFLLVAGSVTASLPMFLVANFVAVDFTIYAASRFI